MIVRFVLENEYGYSYQTSIEYELEVIPRIGEQVYVDVSELVKSALSVGGNKIEYMSENEQVTERNPISLTVANIEHCFVGDEGVYIILVENYAEYLRDNNEY